VRLSLLAFPDRPAAIQVRFLAMALGLGATFFSRSAEFPEQTNDLNFRYSSTNETIRQSGPGLFEIGKLRLDQAKRTITFPAVVNLRQGPIEYVLVTDYGKIHESLLRTEVNPYSIQVALLLLGAIPPATNSPLPSTSSARSGHAPQVTSGSPIGIEISWTEKKRVRRRAVGNFVWDRSAKSRLGKGKWYFCGSALRPDGFAAQLDGSIITVIDDMDAIIGSRAKNREDDDNWLAYGSSLPPAESTVEVVLSVSRQDRGIP
jgi:hypothetical protein